MKKRAISMIILSAILAASVSCGGTAKETKVETDTLSDTVTSDEGTTTDNPRYEIKEDLPERDFDGYVFRILVRPADLWGTDMYSESLNGEVVNDAVYNRNQKVSERFNVNFKQIKASESNVGQTSGGKEILAGEDAYDLLLPHGQLAFQTFASQSMVLDFNSDLPYVDLDKPWWDQDARQSFELNGKLYVMTGDISYLSLAETDCMLFNKKLFDDLNKEYPYELVKSGKWTFDEFKKFVEDGTKDLNGDGEYNPEDDQFGFTSNMYAMPVNVITTAGGRTVSKDESGYPVVTVFTERTDKAMNDYFKLFLSDNCYLERARSQDGKSVTFDSRKLFSDGRAMLFSGILADVNDMRDMNADYGFLPVPKYDETCEKYYTKVDAGNHMLCIPKTVSDTERTSIILEALAAEGYRTVIPAYYEVALQRKYTRDVESSDMLDIIKEGRVFDIGYYFLGDSLSLVGYDMAKAGKNNFASICASKIPSVEAYIKKVMETYGNNLECSPDLRK
ncbi:MAG: hypothetical protein ACLR5G_02510 [Eubacteriales bacterium]